ncbi:sugar dehydrogenase complex small subunit [Bartonella tamiae]|uniref:Uncharacterized protein n=1 Tax=Bartonella tamiae Th239 TaxID=1094558 RepID=J1JVD7_9HYPH|nr:sugar dehydrogenase complex small subunit [Bartonella tamiae]EJF88902.1 hypothetical protein ME5_01453 [Bartonella tamiae Th239]EJF94848.1 hypothetical protein MEG_00429 [Bartonella tamiae Th307]
MTEDLNTSNSEKTLNRRLFLQTGSLTLAVVTMGISRFNALAATDFTDQDQKFLQVSCFLTNRQNLKSDLAKRARHLILTIDEGFDDKVNKINQAIKQSEAHNIDEFLSTAQKLDVGLQDAIMAIVSSWYLGISPLQKNGHPGFITFTDALMYEPTKGITNPPTYAHAGTNYWINPPQSVKIPPMPDGIREWGNRSPKGHGQIPGVSADGTLLRRPIGLDTPLNPYGNEPGTE